MRKKIAITISLLGLAGALVLALIYVLFSHGYLLTDTYLEESVITEEVAPVTVATPTETTKLTKQESLSKPAPTLNTPPPTISISEEENVSEEIPEMTESVNEEIVPGEVTSKTWIPLTEEQCAQSLSESPFFLDPDSVVVRVERDQRIKGETLYADELREISCHPQAIWLTWRDAESMGARVETLSKEAQGLGKIPVFVIYNSPDTQSTKWWVGNNGEDYLNWIEAVAKGVGNLEAWFIVEPDALGLSTDYSEEERLYRTNEIRTAVNLLKEYAPNSRVYIDAGHNKWKTPKRFAELLTASGINEADGFALNIANYQALKDEIARGEAISNLIGEKHYIIDTARNGLGAPSNNEWCNAPGRALGVYPTTETATKHIDAYLWIKPPGESDGTCNGGPTPGKFWLEYALMLVRNAINTRM